MKTYKQILEDAYASDYKVKKFMGPDGKWQERKLRPHRVDFKNSKMRGEPAQDDDRGDVGMKEEKQIEVTMKSGHKFTAPIKVSSKDWHIVKHPTSGKQYRVDHKGNTLDESDTKQEHDLGYSHASQGKKSNPYNPGSASHAAYEAGHEAHKRHFGEQIDEISQKLAGDYYGAATKKHLDKVGMKPNMYGRIEKDMGKNRKAGVDRALDRITGNRKTNEETIVEGAYEKSEENKRSADAAKKQGDMFAHHLHMSDYHDNLSQWHSDKGRHRVADEHAKKSEEHHEKAMELKEQAPVAPVPDRKYIKGTPEWKAHKEKSKPINGHPTNVQEVLSPEMGAGEYIKDFQKSDAPQFKGKSQEKRRMMGIAAYMAAKKNMKEEAEMQEAFINGREYASQGVMHPDHAKMALHQKNGNTIDFYAHGSGDKIPGKVVKNDGKEVHIRATSGTVHKFKVTPHLPKQQNEAKETDVPFDPPYKKAEGNVKDKSGAVHTPMSRARDLARQAMKKQCKEELDLDLNDEEADALMLEALTGQQHKIDKNKNGKVDSHDFKILRGEVCPECGKSPCECATVKESGEFETRSLSFGEFMSQLNEYTPGAGGVYRHKGSSYGAQYRDPEGEDDADDKKKQVAKSEPAVKRGRGRPAGSKSGANQKVTTGRKGSGVDYTGYKLHLPNTNR